MSDPKIERFGWNDGDIEIENQESENPEHPEEPSHE